jgi:hypothetical protein
MSGLAPSTIPRTGRLTVSGRITNRSRQTWTDLNVYLLTSTDPIRSRTALAEAARSDAAAPVGERRTDPGLYEHVGNLAPGQSVPYRLSVRRKDLGLSGAPGVYWVGVHVLGANRDGRDTVADGRARTFMPLLPRPRSVAGQRDRTRLALLVPLEQQVRRGTAGRVRAVHRWQRVLGTDGRLDRLLQLSGRAHQPMTWVVDPALLDAVRSLARGNPPLDVSPSADQTGSGESPSASPTPTPTPTLSPSQSPTPSAGGAAGSGGNDTTGPSASPSGSASTATGGDSATATPSLVVAARAWLDRFDRQATAHGVVALPYGQLDAAAVLTSRDPAVHGLYRRAVGLSRQTLAEDRLDAAVPALDPVGGYLPEAALDEADPRSVVLLGQSAFPGATDPVLTRPGRATVVLTDTAAGSGGPAPNSRYAALELRQRLLSDAALHAMSAQRGQPLVVSTPPMWNPGDAWSTSGFFHGLHTPWLDMVDLASVVATAPARPATYPAPVYPAAQRRAELPDANLRASHDLVRAGQVFAALLADNDTVDTSLARMAMLGSSQLARARPEAAARRAWRSQAYVRTQLSQVRVEGPPFVMMSGESGPIQVTIVNDLDQRVTVGLRVLTPGSNLQIRPVDPVTIGPTRRTSIRLEARSNDIGVHSVMLETTDVHGAPLGSTTQFSVRTSHVSTLIWVVMAAGGGLLFLAAAVRLFRRVRRRKATHGPLLPRPPGPVADERPRPAPDRLGS